MATSSDNMMCCGSNKFEENESLLLLWLFLTTAIVSVREEDGYCEGWEEMTEREEER